METVKVSGKKVVLILDPDFGPRIEGAYTSGNALWAISSPKNNFAVQTLREKLLDKVTGDDITIFKASSSSEGSFLAELGEIDLHFGSFVDPTGYRILEVIGLQYAAKLGPVLREHGFFNLKPMKHGFVATRDGKNYWREEIEPEELKKIILARMSELLTQMSSETIQREMQRNLPLPVPQFLSDEWFDGFNMPKSLENSAGCFSEEEIAGLCKVNEILERKIRALVVADASLDDVLARAEWRELMAVAADCLRVMSR